MLRYTPLIQFYLKAIRLTVGHLIFPKSRRDVMKDLQIISKLLPGKLGGNLRRTPTIFIDFLILLYARRRQIVIQMKRRWFCTCVGLTITLLKYLFYLFFISLILTITEKYCLQ